MRNIKFLFASLLLPCISINVFSQQLISLNLFATGLVKPVDIKHCGDSRIFVVEQDGYIRILDSAGNINPVPFLDINTEVGSSGNEQGLLGLAFSPNYQNDHFFYVNYTDNNGDSHIARFMTDSLNPNSAIVSSEELLLKVQQPFSNHNGGSLAFGPDGYLYAGFGDGGSAGDPGDRAQNPKEYLGKILRLDVSSAPGYQIPNDNPFINDTLFNPEIFEWGVRNPWRFSFDHINGNFWIGDVGQGTWEEVDVHAASTPGGENFGWRCYEGNAPYNTAGCLAASSYVPPVVEYQHSGFNGCSITGGYVYRGGTYNSLFGKYIYTDYCSGLIWSLHDSAGTYISNMLGNFTDNNYSGFGEDYLHELYLAENTTGHIVKIGDSTCLPVAFIFGSDTMRVCDTIVTLQTPAGNGFFYQWKLSGNALPNGNNATYTTTQPGSYTVEVTNPAFCTNFSQPVYVSFFTPPVVSMDTLQNIYCINLTSVPLTGNPSGGTFYGKGVSGNNFNPSAAGAGTYKITYMYTDPNGCSGSASQTVVVDPCAYIHESPASGNMKVIPNPSNGNFELRLPEKNNGNYDIVISDLAGKTILTADKMPSDNGKISIGNHYLQPGIYLLKATDSSGNRSVVKIIIQ
jgi:glucose/arabinose dehydrogenase